MKNMKLKIALILIVVIYPISVYSQVTGKIGTLANDALTSVYNIIPKPVSVRLMGIKPVIVNGSSYILSDPQFAAQAGYLKEQIFTQCGLQLSVLSAQPIKKKSSVLILKYDNVDIDRPEMYLMIIRNNQIIIKARDVAGIIHGIQTLIQLLPLNSITTITIPSVIIKDYPRFRYRGMHLDVSRHFFSVDFIKKYIDFLTFYKFNTFHWHLTDDQGWRIEIKSYPKLTQVGAWRDSTLVGHFRDKPARFDGTPYGGFYTQEEVKDIIKYANIRGITIIPEIDIPGHSRAIIASYPELSTNPETTWDVATTWGMYNRQNNVLAPNAKTFAFLKKTFDEIADLFPSTYIHIGGDECSKIWWKADPKIQAFIKEHGLKDESGLQTYFIQQVINDLKLKGKKVIGWDEILEGDPDTSAIIMNWRGIKAAVQAVKEKHYVIMSPSSYTYFNYSQTKKEDSLTAGGYLPLDKVYNFEPIPEELKIKNGEAEPAKYILGAQGNVWTEYITNEAKLEYMVFPRMTALSEALWTIHSEMNFTDFKRRLKVNAIPRYHFWNSNFFNNYEF